MRRSRTKYLSATLHRIERNTVVAEARRAGFLMVGESAVLRGRFEIAHAVS